MPRPKRPTSEKHLAASRTSTSRCRGHRCTAAKLAIVRPPHVMGSPLRRAPSSRCPDAFFGVEPRESRQHHPDPARNPFYRTNPFSNPNPNKTNPLTPIRYEPIARQPIPAHHRHDPDADPVGQPGGG